LPPNTNSQTKDVHIFDSTAERELSGSQTTPLPKLHLLYHIDLKRVGSVSHPNVEFEAGEWLTIGRGAPEFSTSAHDDAWLPLLDPTISRSQLKIRWLKDEHLFELEPDPAAKRKLLSFRPGEPGAADEIRQRVRLPPGASVAIEDRVLLGLDVSRLSNSIDEERLGLVGESSEMWRLRQEILEVGKFKKPVLILGETGVGKELVASAIHQHGQTPRGPFQPVNCAAMPEQLVESMLFGHTKGAFTGADANKEGLFKAAHQGTLFLDELGEMPISIQPKLLRTLQDGMVTAVGQSKSNKADVRLVAATNRDPEAEIKAGRLRADLYHRLSAHVIQVPPLRARRFDIPALFLHFLQQLRRDHPQLEGLWQGGLKWRPTIPLSFFIELMSYQWHGNIRELENAAEKTARRNLQEGPFQHPDLRATRMSPPEVQAEVAPSAGSLRAASPPKANDNYLLEASQRLGIAKRTAAKFLDVEALALLFANNDETLSTRIKEHAAEQLYKTLCAHDFSQAHVAKALGLSAWTLIRLMQELGFVRPADLSKIQIEDAILQAKGDISKAANQLKVSEHGLKRRLGELLEG
jgi:two-component system nitrogen regulation response regulator GlnG